MPEFDAIADDLFARGWSLCPVFLTPASVAALCAEIEQVREQLQPAGVGRGVAHAQDQAIRSDQIRWLDSAGGQAQAEFLGRMELLRLTLNQRLQLGLFDYEAHFARYAPGSFYQRHVDAFQSAGQTAGRSELQAGGASARADLRPRRVLSSVIYLNADWTSADGGELAVWDSNDNEIVRLLPQAGQAVFFMSGEFPHAVLAARRERLSIAGWFRCRAG